MRRSAWKIMGQLIRLVYPLLPVMAGAVVLGTAGYLCAIFLTVLAVQVLAGEAAGQVVFVLLGILAVSRGVLHYAEQYCNHFIAFKLLAIIRHRVFAVLRKLAPAKLEGRDKGNLISIITSDIELLEVFYAHTVSPIAIAVFTSAVMAVFIGSHHVVAGIFALAAYSVVGAVIPLWNGKRGAEDGMRFRNAFGELNSFTLDSLRGLDETVQYGHGGARKAEMEEKSEELAKRQQVLSSMEGSQRAVTHFAILLFSFGMLFFCLYLEAGGQMDFAGVLTCTVAMMGSFGPVVALASLSNNLSHTLASGERVLALLEEQPAVREIPDKQEKKEDRPFEGICAEEVSFAYEEEVILKGCSLQVEKGRIIGIHGASGSGKSTLLKLFMRFWDPDRGQILLSGEKLDTIPTRRLRDTESYVTQETHLFHDSIANNIAVGRPGASREEIMEAARKASIHSFIMSLPEGYDTKVGELGDTLSGGERQRIGIARAFLHDAPLVMLDEPTSNLDALNEGIILKSLKESCQDKTVILVSHRQSTMNIADQVFEMESERVS